MTDLSIGTLFIALIFGIVVFLRILYAFGLFSWWDQRARAQDKKAGGVSFRRRYIEENYLESYYHYHLSPAQLLRFNVIFAFAITGSIIMVKGGYDFLFADFDLLHLKLFSFKVAKWTFAILGVLFLYSTAKIILPSIFLLDFPYLLRGNRAQGKKEFTAALQYFEKAIKYFPSEYGYYKIGKVKSEIEKARIERVEAEKQQFVEPYFDEAIEAYSKSLEFNHQHYKTYEEKAELQLEMVEYNEAIDSLNKALQIVPEKSIFWINQKLSTAYKERALCKEAIGDRPGAIEDLSQAISLNPNNVDLLQERAKLKHWTEDLQGAIEDNIKFVTSSRHLKDSAMLQIQNLHEVQGKFEDYITLIRSLINGPGKDEADYYIKQLAELMIGRGDTQSAIRLYKKSSSIEEDLLEQFLTWEDRFQKGSRRFDRESSTSSYYREKAKFYTDFGKLDEAIDILNEGSDYIKSQTERLNYYLDLGNIHLKNWDYANAIDTFYQGCELDNERQYLVFDHSLAIIRKNQAEFHEALVHYQRFLALRRKAGLELHEYMYLDMIEILTALRMYEEASEMINDWDEESDSKYFSYYNRFGFKIDKMISIREKIQAKEVLGQYLAQ